MDSTQDGTGELDQQAILEHFAHIQRVAETVFLVLQVVGGQVLLPLLVLAIIFSKKVSRHPIFTNFCFSWIVSSIFYSLLVYRGRSTAEELSLNPSHEACLVQAALMNGAQALTSCTTLALILYLYLLLRECISEKSFRLMWFGPSTEVYILLVFPLFAFIAFAVATTAVGNRPVIIDGLKMPDTTLAIPTVFYCVILLNGDFAESLDEGFIFLRVVYILFASISIVCFIFEVIVACQVYRCRAKIKNIAEEGWLQMFLRVVLFSFYRMVALSLNFAIIAEPDEIVLTGLSKNNLFNGAIDFVQASIPLVAFLIFGTERQFMDVWCFWRWWRWPWKRSPSTKGIEEEKGKEHITQDLSHSRNPSSNLVSLC